MYYGFLIPKLKNLLRNNSLQNSIIGQIDKTTLNTMSLNFVLNAGLQFVMQMKYTFVIQGHVGEDFLESRPDFYLGRLMSMFPNFVFPSDFGYTAVPTIEPDPISKATYTMYKTLSTRSYLLTYLRGNASCLVRLGQILLPQQYETLLDIIKHSQLGNTTQTADDRRQFFDKYVKNAYNLKALNKTEPKYLENDLNLLSFCYLGSTLDLNQKSDNWPDMCNLFQPCVTGKGLCHTFNGLPMKDVYIKSPVTDLWNKVFNPNQDVQLEHPTGYGPANGFNVVLNMFKTKSMEGSSKNVILSFTNEREWVSIFANNFIIEPGYSYTFKIIANQIITTERLAELSPKDRKCNLPLDTYNLQLMKEYSKGGCLYECAITKVVKYCNCTPWNMPRVRMENPPFCEANFTQNIVGMKPCHDNVLSNFSVKDCDCPSNCYDTTFTVFDFKSPLENPGQFCDSLKKTGKQIALYPYSVFCDICWKARIFYKILFNYRFVVEKSINFEDDYKSFCSQFLMENVAIIKAEIATPTLIQSKRDKRFSFEGQISELGKLVTITARETNLCLIFLDKE